MPENGFPATDSPATVPHPGTAVGATWLVNFQPRPDARIKLICAHHAGGSSQYFEEWPNVLPDNVEVLALNLPGRGSRRQEGLVRRLDTVVETVANALEPHIDRPYAMFGDSIGSLICFEVIRRLRREGKPLPVRLIASGMVAPQIVWWNPDAPMHRMPDADLFQGLVREAGMLDEKFLADDGLREVMLPVLRADLEIAETYCYKEDVPLDVPITASRGDADILLTFEQVDRWCELTTGPFEHLTFPGNHFYSRDQHNELLDVIYARLDADLASFPSSVVRGDLHDYPRMCLHELFSDQAKQTPNAEALVQRDKRYTYKELDEETDALARWLLNEGVKKGDLVGILMERCAEHVVALIAINKAGGIFMPLDFAYPAETLRKFVHASGARIFLTKPRWKESIPDDLRQLCSWHAMDENWQGSFAIWEEKLGEIHLPETDPDETAFMSMSSGTSGAPKGICQSHRAQINAYWHRYVNAPYVNHEREACNVYFIWYVWLPLFRGASAWIVPDDVIYDPRLFVSFIEENKITRMTISPSLLERILKTPGLNFRDSLGSLVNVTIIGEVVPSSLVSEFCSLVPHCTLTHAYGCAETHDAASKPLTPSTPSVVSQKIAPAGRPQINQRIYVLDENMCPLPRGVPGEIYVGGDSLAKGYFSDEQNTALRFVSDPIRGDGARLFKTGDRGRILLDGDLQVLGRMDSMVKLRGYSVMLGAVEGALLEHPAISNAVVVPAFDEDTGRPDHLIAYIVPTSSRTQASWAEDLRSFLLARLSHYAVPSFVVPMTSLPVDARSNSKVDRRGFPKPGREHLLSTVTQKASPRNDRDTRISEEWCEVLGVDSVGIDEDFFALGGHSLLAAELCGRLNERNGWSLRVADVFRYPTVAQQSDHVRTLSAN